MHRIWSVAGKVLGGLFLLEGGTVSTGILLGIESSHATGGILTLLWVLLVFFGLAPASLGGWLLHTSFKSERQALREQFFTLLKAKRGKLSLLDFAAATRLEPAIARRQLDSWAKEFSATFEVSESGDIYYVFATEPSSLPENQHWQILDRMIRYLESTPQI